MPDYTYIDPNGHTETISQPMLFSGTVICAACGLEMWRKPQLFRVNWSGLPPSKQVELHPEVKDAIQNGERNREKYLEMEGDNA